jgi:NAD(P)-dependent dehydrogenase (short-subunit alcohol dehydrogenase family)
VDSAVAALGELHVLVNNVGSSGGIGKLDTISDQTWHSLVELNLTSAFLMTKAAMPAITANTGCSIVNIASVAGLQAMGSFAYGGAKGGLVGFTHDIAMSYGREGVRANVIAPGHLFTPFVFQKLDPEARERRRMISPLGVEGDAWDVAAVALFLASDEALRYQRLCAGRWRRRSDRTPSRASHARVVTANISALTGSDMRSHEEGSLSACG